MNVDYKLIGSRIKSVRKSRELTQEALAEKLDVSIGYISQVERGITKISLDLLGAISGILECDIAFLITESAVSYENYKISEIQKEFQKLTDKEKAFVIDFIDLLKSNR